MKVNIQCALKYLRHDYKEIGGVLLWAVGAILVILALWWQINNPIWNGYMALNASAAIVVLLFTVGIATRNKEFFKDWKPNGELVESGHFAVMALIFGAIPYGIYTVFDFASGFKWEDPTLSAIIFATLILIGTPIGCAIARCKEE